MFSLEDKITIITGGANGIGAATVKEFCKEKAKFVAILDIDVISGAKLEKGVNIEYGAEKTRFYKCDVTNDEELHGIYDKIVNEFGYIDVVVNNAGLATEDLSSFKKEIEVNYSATVSSTLKALGLMRVDHGGKGGTIINISSSAALTQCSPFIFVYAGSKSAVLQFSNCIGREDYYKHTKVRVITVCFSATETDILTKVTSYDPIINDAMKYIAVYNKNKNIIQSAEEAAKGIVQGYKNGKSGSTWLVNTGKVYDVTDKVTQAYKIMSENVEF